MSDAVSTDVILAELRGLEVAQNIRFDSIERDQQMAREWMARLTDSISRQVEITSKFYAYDERLTRAKVDIAENSTRLQHLEEVVTYLKEKGIRSGVILNAVTFLAGVFVSALAGLIFHADLIFNLIANLAK